MFHRPAFVASGRRFWRPYRFVGLAGFCASWWIAGSWLSNAQPLRHVTLKCQVKKGLELFRLVPIELLTMALSLGSEGSSLPKKEGQSLRLLIGDISEAPVDAGKEPWALKQEL
ncbi:hypothetical protein BDW71DRAFT_189182 [Aspergillus fruticulosus]